MPPTEALLPTIALYGAPSKEECAANVLPLLLIERENKIYTLNGFEFIYYLDAFI